MAASRVVAAAALKIPTRLPQMPSGHVPHKLHLVTLVKSGIRRPYWEKRCLKELGLVKRLTSVVLKNTPQINERLAMIKKLIVVQPITVDEEALSTPELLHLRDTIDADGKPQGDLAKISGVFLNEQGVFNPTKYAEYVQNFPQEELEQVLSKSHVEGSELLNRDFRMEEEALITDPGEKISLFFEKQTVRQFKRLKYRKRNNTKY